MMFEEELKKLLKEEFHNETLDSLSVFPNALTTVAYKVNFKSGKKFVVKIGFDEKDIKKGKGIKEKTAIKLANDIIGFDNSPKLVKYIDKYPSFPGYITILDFINGKVLDAEIFNKVASSESNLDELSDILIKLHSFKQKTFSDLLPNGKRNIYEYFVSEHEDIKSALESDNLFEKLENQYNKLPRIYEYFKNFQKFSFLHGDVNFKNVLMSENKIKALIDWDRSLIGPIGFEFAHVSTLAANYGVSKWHNNLIKSYLDKYTGDPKKLYKEFKMIELFIYFKLLMRKLTHKHEKDKVEICIETKEELKDHFIRKILEYKS